MAVTSLSRGLVGGPQTASSSVGFQVVATTGNVVRCLRWSHRRLAMGCHMHFGAVHETHCFDGDWFNSWREVYETRDEQCPPSPRFRLSKIGDREWVSWPTTVAVPDLNNIEKIDWDRLVSIAQSALVEAVAAAGAAARCNGTLTVERN